MPGRLESQNNQIARLTNHDGSGADYENGANIFTFWHARNVADSVASTIVIMFFEQLTKQMSRVSFRTVFARVFCRDAPRKNAVRLYRWAFP